MARPHIEPYVDRTVDYKKMTLPGFGNGMQYKMLSFDIDSGACTMNVRFEQGYRQPPGFSYSEIELFVLKGKLKFGKTTYHEGHYFHIPAGVSMPEMTAPRGAEALLMFNGSEPSFVESDADHSGADRAKLQNLNAYEDIPWLVPNITRPATATGCLLKILKFDERTHAISFLYILSPEFWQDNISYHDCAEESYHIWGTSWMMQFGDLPTGGYFWRPPYINHGAFASKRGCIAFGRTDNILYNHFHFNPWTNTQENQERAVARLANRNPELYKWVLSRDHNHPHPQDFEFEGPMAPHDHDHEHGHEHEHEHDLGKGKHRHAAE
jgi:hypothetical protein